MEFTLDQLKAKADAISVDGNLVTATFGLEEINVKLIGDKLGLQPSRSSQHRRLIEYLTAR